MSRKRDIMAKLKPSHSRLRELVENTPERPQTNTALLALIDASPDAGECSAAEAAEWAERLREAIERTLSDGAKHNQG